MTKGRESPVSLRTSIVTVAAESRSSEVVGMLPSVFWKMTRNPCAVTSISNSMMLLSIPLTPSFNSWTWLLVSSESRSLCIPVVENCVKNETESSDPPSKEVLFES